MKRDWVILQWNAGRVQAVRDYGDHAWGSALYNVAGYVTGTYREATRVCREVSAGKQLCDCGANLFRA